MNTPKAATLESAVRQAFSDAAEAGHAPGGVVLAGCAQERVLALALGHRSVVPERTPMGADTIFDMASLTKPLATTIAALLLRGDGLLTDWDARVGPALHRPVPDSKATITFRHLLTHTSGLPPYLNADNVRRQRPGLPGHDQVLEAILAVDLHAPPGTVIRYSCLNFILAARALQELTRQRLDALLGERVWGPVGMCDTSFFPVQTQLSRCAPTEQAGSTCLQGTVHDPLAQLVQAEQRYCSGNAGLFSTASDMERLCLVLLRDGRWRDPDTGCGDAILPPGSLGLLTGPQTPIEAEHSFSIGWNVYEPEHGFGVPQRLWAGGDATRAIGHSGYTGTMVWLHPASGSYLLLLTNRVHPEDKGTVHPLRTAVIGALRKYMAGVATDQEGTRRGI